MRVRHAPVLALASLLALPASAAGQASGDVTVTLTPPVAKKPSRLHVRASGQATSSGQQPPNAISLFIARGFKINRRAVRRLCNDQQANSSTCPRSSRVATGSGQGEANVPLFGRFPFTISIEAFLTRRQQPGDIAGVVIQTRTSRGQGGSRRGRLIRLGGTGPFGVELRFDNLDFGQRQAPPGSTIRLDRLDLDVHAKRRVRRVRRVRRRVRTRGGKIKIKRKRVVRRRRYYLIRNPRSCTSPWPYQVRVGFPNGVQVRDGSVVCRPR
jgi:hypothetical protein